MKDLFNHYFDFLNGNDLPLSIVIGCLILFVFVIYSMTAFADKPRKDTAHKIPDDDDNNKE